MTYGRTLDWLYSLEARRGMDFRLERLHPVLAALADPQSAFPAVHVAGTNGKGSTAAMLHAIYRAAGYRPGLYTSPHLLSFRERIRVDADMIAEPAVVEHVERVQDAARAAGADLTFFEITTIVAFLEFRRREVDLAVVEVGLGGRLDATNVVRSAASVIATVGLEHRQYLGDTLAAIAREKAGIIKAGVPVVAGRMPDEAARVLTEVSAVVGAPACRYGEDFDESILRDASGVPLTVSLPGDYQRHNAAVVVATVKVLRERFGVDDCAITAGLASTRWPGRFETLCQRPRTIVDAAHNPAAAAVLRRELEAGALPRPRALVFGVMADKDWRDMLIELAPFFDEVVLVPVGNHRSLDPRRALEVATDFLPATVAPSAAAGWREAARRVGGAGAVVVTGSIFLVAELYGECGGSDNPFEDPRDG